MTPDDVLKIQKWGNKLTQNVSITIEVSEDKRSGDFIYFCKKMEELTQKIHIKKKKKDGIEPPAIKIGSSLRYQSIPEGAELPLFLDALTILTDGSKNLSKSISKPINDIRIPAKLTLIIAPNCPFCPLMVKQIVPLAFASSLIELVIIDGIFFPEIAEANRVKSTPTLLLDEQFRWTGSVQLEDIVDTILHRDPSKLSTASLINLIKDGNASQLAEMMIESRTIFPSFYNLLSHEKWPVRLGAMVAVEYIAEKDPQLCTDMIEPLWDKFPHVDDSTKGDILYILGETGKSENISRLEAVKNGTYDAEIIEAATEAIEKITGSN